MRTQTVPTAFPAGFGLLSSQCGMNAPSPVSDRYEAPFRYGNGLDRVVVELGEASHATTAGLWDSAMHTQ